MNITPLMAFFQFKFLKFVLAPQPNVINIRTYVEKLMRYNVNTIVKVSESYYNLDEFASTGILVKELIFPDGSFPSSTLIDHWLEFVRNYFETKPDAALAVHCQSGLGRSAVLIAIAMIECGLERSAVIDIIRKERRGTFNSHQLKQLLEYNSQNRLLEVTSSI